MELSPSWEADSCAATQELPLLHNLSQVDPAHTTPYYLSKIHFNIIHLFTSWSS
jgi:hypothetical protein